MPSDSAVSAPLGGVLHLEEGASWWTLAVVPALCASGVVIEALLGGPVHVLGWTLAGLVLGAPAVLNIRARRRYVSVRVTPVAAQFGPEWVPLADIAEVLHGDPPLGARVLGGGLAVPRRTTGVALRLKDGTAVVGFSRRPDVLRDALRRALQQRS